MNDKGSLDRLINPEDQQRLLDKIARIEKRSSGEVRIHVSDRPVKDPLEAARRTFTSLGMTRTMRRNGVLVFLSLPSRKFAIVGDEGVDRVSPSDYWDALRDAMSERFAAGSYTEGLLGVLDRVEAVLVEHFPYEAGDLDELPDEISYEPPRSKALPWLIVGGIAITAALLYGVWRLFFSGWM
ncbi:MAG: TPM domain-containing protein [Spirochaetaceae bacterium]|nr:MAG: TPM domain-containing protein [Spirochaetaceae bacterium]